MHTKGQTPGGKGRGTPKQSHMSAWGAPTKTTPLPVEGDIAKFFPQSGLLKSPPQLSTHKPLYPEMLTWLSPIIFAIRKMGAVISVWA